MPGLLGDFGKGLLGFVSDPQSWKDMGTNAVGLLGAPLPSKQEALAMALRRRMQGSVMRDYPSAETDLANSYREKMQNVALGMNPILAVDLKALGNLRDTWGNRGVTLDAYASPNSDKISLSKIEVPKDQRGQGIGSAAMADLARLADESGATVTLSPATDFGATSIARLKDFYKRAGFVENKGRNKDFAISDSMYRIPQKGE